MIRQQNKYYWCGSFKNCKCGRKFMKKINF